MDAWVADLDEAAMEKQIGETQRALQKKRMREAELDLKESMLTTVSLKDVINGLLGLMNRDETVAKAMKRLSSEAAALRKNKKPKVQKSIYNISKPDPQTVATNDTSPVDKLIELADYGISEYGLFNVYGLSYTSLDASLCMWEYRLVADGKEVTHGPFASEQIADWKKAGYFTGATAVEMRKVEDIKRNKPKIVDMFGDEEETPDPTSQSETEVRSVAAVWISSDDIDFNQIISIPQNSGIRKEQESAEIVEDDEDSEHEDPPDSDSDHE